MLKKLLILIFALSTQLSALAQSSDNNWKSLNQKVVELYGQNRYEEAVVYAEKAVLVAKKEFGENHPNYATSLNNLALLYKSVGRYAEAEPLYTQAIEIRRVQLGEDHPDYGQSLSNLAALFELMGQYVEAEPLMLKAIEIKKAQLGEDYPSYANALATSLNNLSALYENLGHFAKAEALYTQAMGINKTYLVEYHPAYATSLNQLAMLYKSMGRYTEADSLYKQAIETFRAQLGEDHPAYASSLNNLAGLYLIMGRYADAEPLYTQAIEIRKAKLGEDHPAYASSLNNMALLYKNMGKHAESERLFTQAMGVFKSKLSDDHPDYATSLNNLAFLYQNRDRYAEAEPLYMQAIEIRKAQLGEDHPDYATSLNNLAAMYQKTFEYDKAGAVSHEIKRISEEILEKDTIERKQVPRLLQAANEETLKTANMRPFIATYAPDPLQRNERGVIRLATPNFTIKGFATAAYGIKQLQINGQDVPVFPDGVWQYPIQLENGENQVLIKAVAHSGDETFDTLILNYENEQVIRSEAPRRFLLSIGINDYTFESWQQLHMPVKDAHDLLGALVEKYDITEIDTLFNQSASFANVRDRLKHLIGATRPQDEVIIFFAGHGEYDEDFDEDGKWILANGRLGNASLAAVIEKMAARHVLVLADACFSGSLYLKRGEGQEAAEARNLRRSRWVLASGSMETVLDQMPGKQNSPFAWHLIDFLQKAEGDVPVSALRDHLETQVPKYADQKPVSGPIKSDDGGEFIFRQKDKKLESTP